MSMTIDALNSLTEDEARTAFMKCCTASRWVDLMVANRPYSSVEGCQSIALDHWRDMSEKDVLEAFEGHPKIGDVSSLREKYASIKALASGEQSAVQEADDTTLQELAGGNTRYEKQNGFIFIVCATGKSAKEMLNLLEARLINDRDQELSIAAAEQAKITAIRIDKLLRNIDD